MPKLEYKKKFLSARSTVKVRLHCCNIHKTVLNQKAIENSTYFKIRLQVE